MLILKPSLSLSQHKSDFSNFRALCFEVSLIILLTYESWTVVQSCIWNSCSLIWLWHIVRQESYFSSPGHVRVECSTFLKYIAAIFRKMINLFIRIYSLICFLNVYLIVFWTTLSLYNGFNCAQITARLAFFGIFWIF